MEGKLQGKRAYFQDYRKPWFYMVTMTTLRRVPLFGTCRNHAVDLSPAGQIAEELWCAIPQAYPQLEMQTHIIMPDHLHGIIRVKEEMPQPLGVPIRAFKSLVTSRLRKSRGDSALQVWNPGFHDAIVLRRGALSAYANYIGDNPRRYCVRQENPDLFVRVNGLCHRRLPLCEQWNGYGNLFLLDKPLLMNVKVSRHATPSELQAVKERVRQSLNEGVVIVSPFISPGEKEIAEMVMGMAYGNVILMKPGGFGDYYKPSGRYFDLCAQGRVLILSAFADATSKVPLTRERCLSMNAWCEAICEANGDMGDQN